MPSCARVLARVMMKCRWPRIPRTDAWRQTGWGVPGLGMHASLLTHGIRRPTALSSALILACGPVLTLLILSLARIERLRRAQVVGVALACTGVLVLTSSCLVGGRHAAVRLSGVS
jgi:drug/metabolite transporter (DMT)-like permease